jgi:hypothetical protein
MPLLEPALHATLAQYFYGFEYTSAVKIFMVGFAALALIAALLMRMSLKFWIIAGILFATALTAPVDWKAKVLYSTWMLPIQKLRAEIHLGLGILLTLIVLFSGRVDLRRAPAQGILLLALGIYAGLMQFIHDTPPEALQTIGFALGTIPCMIAAVPMLTRDYDGCTRMLRCLMWVSVLWTVCCSIQFVINPRFLLNDSGRFWGLLANAQQAAIFVAPLAVTALWLLVNDRQKRLKPLWVGLLAINMLFVMWTASRTGAAMFVLGASLVLYSRAGRAVLLMPVAALVFFGLYTLAVELQIMSNVERLTSSTDTRGWVWQAQIGYFMDSPLVGVGWGETGGSESSYLGGAAGYGIGYLGLTLIFLLWSFWLCLRLFIGRRLLPREQRPMVDMFLAWNAMYFAGAAFEGYILARSSTTQVMMLMFAGIGVYLREAQAAAVAAGREVWHEDEEDHALYDQTIVDQHAASDYGFDTEAGTFAGGRTA